MNLITMESPRVTVYYANNFWRFVVRVRKLEHKAEIHYVIHIGFLSAKTPMISLSYSTYK